MRTFAKLIILALSLAPVAGLSACASGPDEEEVARREQLMKLETDNIAHERDGLAKDLAQVKAANAALEQSLAEAKKAGEECRTDANQTHERLSGAEQRDAVSTKKVKDLQGQLGEIRDLISTGKIDRKKVRAKVLDGLQDIPATDNTSH